MDDAIGVMFSRWLLVVGGWRLIWIMVVVFLSVDRFSHFLRGGFMDMIHLTLEPAEENTDGSAVTVYTVTDDVEMVRKEVVGLRGFVGVLPLSVDVGDDFFEVVRTRAQPFAHLGVFRFQGHPTC